MRHIPENPLPGPVDVAVIGAGVIGCSIAYQLAKRGNRVAVFDRRGISSGASGRNGGLTGSGSALHSDVGEAVYAFTSQNFSMLQDELTRELNDDFSLRVTGSLDLATSEDHASFLQESVREQQEHGVNVEWLDAREVRDLLPGIGSHVLGAELKANGGHLWPFQLVHALADSARNYGATFHTHSHVEQVLRDNGEVTGLQTEHGTVDAGAVVVATNAWTRNILPDLPDGAIVPARGQILVTQPVAPVLPLPFSTNFDKEYGRQTHSGQLLCGGFRRFDIDEGLGHFTERVNAPTLGAIANCLTRLFPKFGPLRVVRCWAGIMGFTADGLPMLGSYGSDRGLYVAAGFNGGGFSWAASVGKSMAQLVSNGRSTLDLDPFDPNRFASGEATWSNPFTAGEKNNPRSLGAGEPVN